MFLRTKQYLFLLISFFVSYLSQKTKLNNFVKIYTCLKNIIVIVIRIAMYSILFSVIDIAISIDNFVINISHIVISICKIVISIGNIVIDIDILTNKIL